MPIFRFVPVAVLAAGLAACSSLASFDITGSIPAAAPAPNGHVYIFRGIGGRMASLDLDELGEKVNRTGVTATVLNFTEWRTPAEEAIKRHEIDPRPAPIILIGHSAGGDAALSFAYRLKEKGIPVSLVVTFDPTRRAGEVPANVERYINIYQSTNFFGGGDVKAATDFRGHFATINLKQYWNVLHVNLLKIDGLQDRVLDKIAQVTAMAPSLDGPATPIQYVMPRDLPIEIFDSGIPAVVGRGENLQAIAVKYSVPPWALAAVNNLGDNAALRPGQKLVIPRHLETPQPVSPGLTSLAAPDR
jgi:pimeloyl-ACP methyl ester carboxylesterase